MSEAVRQPRYKRAFDVFAATIAILVATPIFLAITIAIKLTSRGPVFFVQDRSGLHGQLFSMFKFRTMVAGNHVVVGTETAVDDPRITPIGQWLRRTGFDELPQLFNVLKGDMSLIGPRPLLQWENDMCNPRERKRLLVRPGITGLSQVNGRNAIRWRARVEWDVRYVEQLSLRMDLWILWRTIPAIFVSNDAYAPVGCDVYADVENVHTS